MSPADPAVSWGRPLVSVVLVAHDGARWLPGLLDSLERQTRLPDRLVAVDTGSRDATPQILARALGPGAVVTADRHTGFGAAVALGLRHLDDQAAAAAAPYRASVHWVWVLHDDMRLDPEALQRLMAATDGDPGLSLVGPKVREWPRRRRLLEMGLTVTGTARRLTGVDRGEYDQGQHDRQRDTLAVGSAGLLVRRRVWDELGGFDPALALFGDDLDLGWRAARAGHRSAVCPDAVVFHAEAAARGQRGADAVDGRPGRVARRHVLYTVLANCRGWAVAPVAVRLLLGSLLRALGLLVVKAPREAADELLAVAAVLARPLRLARGRRSRRRTQVRRGARVRPLLAPWWAPYGHGLDLVGDVLAEAADAVTERAGVRRDADTHAGPVAEEAQDLATEPGALSLLLRRPMAVVFGLLTLLSLVAGVDAFGPGLLQGGALLPAPPGAGDWWRTYAESWHPVALGSDVPAPPYVAVLGALGTLLLGKAWLVPALLFGFAVPLTAAAGYVLAHRVVRSRTVALWAAVTYGLLPVLTGAVAQGRLGTVAAAMLLPLVARVLMAALGAPDTRRRRRAVVGAGMLLAALAAFAPLVLPVTVVVALAYWLGTGAERGVLRRLAALLALAVLLLMPWVLHLGLDPVRWSLGEAGHEAGAPAAAPAAWGPLLGRPGGPGQAPVWLTAGLALAAVAALLRPDRRRPVLTAWGAGLAALAVAVAQQRAGHWPGSVVLLAQGAAVCAAAAVGDGVADRVGGARFGWRQPLVALVAGCAVLAPVLGAGWWVLAQDPPLLRRQPRLALPSFMADEQVTAQAPRTLVLAGRGPALSVHLSRGIGLYTGLEAVAPPPADGPALLAGLAARLVTEPRAADVAALAEHGVGYVLASGTGADAVAALDGAPGLARAGAGELDATAWRLDATAGPVRVAASDPLTARALADDGGAPDTLGARVPAGPAARLLTLGEHADPGWRASIGGTELSARVSHGWGQGFAVPARGGALTVVHESWRGLWLIVQALAVALAVVYLLPARRRPDAPV
jgi:GT2 family glycosyltransferase